MEETLSLIIYFICSLKPALVDYTYFNTITNVAYVTILTVVRMLMLVARLEAHTLPTRLQVFEHHVTILDGAA